MLHLLTPSFPTLRSSGLLAWNEIRAALAYGTPFSVPVADLRRLGEGDPEIAAALEGWGDMAETGIPTLAQLTQQFKAKASDVAGRIRPHTGEKIGRAHV